jgi:hypothetical protein
MLFAFDFSIACWYLYISQNIAMQNTAQYEILVSKDLDVQLGVIIKQHLKTSAPAIYDQGRLFSLHA